MSVFRRLLAGGSQQVTPAQAKKLQSSGAILLDVREGHEWKAGHAPKALHVPLPLLESSLSRISRDNTILTVCRSGSRSARAAKLLAGLGFTVRTVSGGMSAWSRAGLPVVANGGRAGHIV